MSDTLPALRATLAELVALDTTSSRPNAPLIDYAQTRLE
ncbi:MAG: acetylornithine deacetylase, partial [Myxococcaceae bacterium]